MGFVFGLFLGAMGDMTPLQMVNGREVPQGPLREQVGYHSATSYICTNRVPRWSLLPPCTGGTRGWELYKMFWSRCTIITTTARASTMNNTVGGRFVSTPRWSSGHYVLL